jgi:hypothetical protein
VAPPPPAARPSAQPAKIPLRTHLAYLAGALFALILGALVGSAGGYFAGLHFAPAPPGPTGPAQVTFRIPDTATLEVDGQPRGKGPSVTVELTAEDAHQVKLLVPGHEPLDLPMSITAGERRTVVVAIAEPDAP